MTIVDLQNQQSENQQSENQQSENQQSENRKTENNENQACEIQRNYHAQLLQNHSHDRTTQI